MCGINFPWSSFAPRKLTLFTLNFLPLDVRPRAEDLQVLLLGNAHSLETFLIRGSASFEKCELFTLPNIDNSLFGLRVTGRSDVPISHHPSTQLQKPDIHGPALLPVYYRGWFFAYVDPYSTRSLFTTLSRHLPFARSMNWRYATSSSLPPLSYITHASTWRQPPGRTRFSLVPLHWSRWNFTTPERGP